MPPVASLRWTSLPCATVRDEWRFVPGRQDGFDVPCDVLLPIHFRPRAGE